MESCTALLSQPRLQQFAQGLFAYFAAGGHRQRIHQLDTFRIFELGDSQLFEEGNKIPNTGVRARLGYDEGAGALAQALVGIAHDRYSPDHRMLEKQILNFRGTDVLAAANDDVLAPANDSEVPGLIHCSQVATVNEALTIESPRSV